MLCRGKINALKDMLVTHDSLARHEARLAIHPVISQFPSIARGLILVKYRCLFGDGFYSN